MGDQLALPDVSLAIEGLPDAPWVELLLGAIATMRRAKSAHTWRAYQRAWAHWHRFCVEFSLPHEPPFNPLHVASWLHRQDAAGDARQTITQRLAALEFARRWACQGSEKRYALLRHDPAIREWLRGHARTSVQPGKASPRGQSRCPTPEEIVQLVHACYARRDGRRGPRRSHVSAARDRCGILLSYYGAMRRSELCALRVCDVELTSRGLEVTFARSKTDQEGRGETRVLYAQSSAELCPVAAWEDWMRVYTPEGPSSPALVPVVAGAVMHRPLTERGWSDAMKRRCKEAGMRHLSPHSLRAALVTHAAMIGKQEGDIAYHARMQSRTTVDRYTRRTKTWTHNPTSGLAPNAIPRESTQGSSPLQRCGGAETSPECLKSTPGEDT